MKISKFLSVFLFSPFFLFFSCGKSSGGGYTNTDHTVGMIKIRAWSGYIYGYIIGDTMLPVDTTHYPWPKYFYHAVNDTSFEVGKIDGFTITMPGTTLPYRFTDPATKLERFDTTLGNAVPSFLMYYPAIDSMSYEFHQLNGLNVNANKYYQVKMYLATH